MLSGVIWLNYPSLTQPRDNFPPVPGVDWRAFQTHCFDLHGNGMFARHPGRVLISISGYVLPRVIIIWSILALIHKVAVCAGAVSGLLPRAPYAPLLIHLLLPFSCYALIARLQRRDFRRYCERVQARSDHRLSALNHFAERSPFSGKKLPRLAIGSSRKPGTDRVSWLNKQHREDCNGAEGSPVQWRTRRIPIVSVFDPPLHVSLIAPAWNDTQRSCSLPRRR